MITMEFIAIIHACKNVIHYLLMMFRRNVWKHALMNIQPLLSNIIANNNVIMANSSIKKYAMMNVIVGYSLITSRDSA